MAGFKIEQFRGKRPRISARKLALGESQTAENLRLGSGDLEPIPEKTTVQAVDAPRMPRTIYLFDNDGAPLWFQWDEVVNVARGPINDDALERTYYTGDTTGDGRPKFTTNNLADQGGGGPYPEDWLYIGVPAPTTAPTLTPTELPEDKPDGERLAQDFFSDELLIDQVQWTVYPGTGTRNQTWRLNSGATGGIGFDIQPGTSFRVTEIINNNKVKIKSATEPGITMRTLNSDKSTVNDWHPMDEQGSTQEADFIGWRVPEDMTIKIISHNLNVGDVITVSALNHAIQFWAALTTDFNEEEWSIEEQIDDAGSTFYQVLDARVSGESFTGEGAWRISGSFYYDVDRASSTISELEDRSYVYTYVNDFGEEGPPSPPSDPVPLLDTQSVLLQSLALPPTIGYNITSMRLYRTNSTEAGTEFQFVKEFAVSRTTRDDVPSDELSEVISTTTWEPPDAAMLGITALPNGMMAGFAGKQVYFCEPFFPHAWPPEYDQSVEFDIVGMTALGNSLVILTKGWPYIATGSHPRNMNLRAIKVNQACVSAQSIASGLDKVYYASPDGLVEISPSGVDVVTDSYLDPNDWRAYNPSTIVGEFFEGRYYGFYDFDVSAIDPVITAEVSGTITDADESDIINGGRTIILELTNDSWVAAGTSFNNQRQAIIDGLTATTAQTLGWNNQIRDLELDVTDVTRFSDSIVLITLPSASGYAITTAETIQPSIPFEALVLSTSDLPTGSTFTVEPQAFSATVTMGGSVDGAAEADIVTGTETITLTLTSDTWESGAVFDAARQGIIDGLSATTDEQNGWNDNVPQLIAVTDVVRTSDTLVTITLPAVPLYSITENESVTATVPHEALVTQEDVDVVTNAVGITATGNAAAIFGGTMTAAATENEVIAGGLELTITLTNDTWIAAGTGPIGTTAQTQSIIDALVAAMSPTNGWNNVVVPGVETADLVRTSATVATITFDAESTYSVADNETISCTLPADVLTTATSPLAVGNTFSITAQSPVTATLSGTITSSTDETDIVDGGKTIILTLSDDTWVAAGATFDAQRQNIIDGLDAASSPTNGWNNEVRDGTPLDVDDVVRTSDTIVTITLPAVPLYDISSTETITATIPATAMVISALAVVASPTFTVDEDVPASIAQSGTLDNDTNDDVISGGSTIILTVSNDTWVDGVDFTNVRQDIIDGLDAATTPAHGGAWNDQVRDVIAVGQVVRTSATVVTITIPATAEYDINADETITVTVPAAALASSAIDVVAIPDVDITANANETGRVWITYLGGSLGGTVRSERSFFDLDYYYQDDDLVGSGSIMLYGAYSEADDRWVVVSNNTIYTSDDDGDTWTSRTSSGTLGSGNQGLMRSDFHDYWFHCVAGTGDFVEYSADGATWTDFTSALSANVTNYRDPELNDFRARRHYQFMYGGDYMYAVVRDTSFNATFVRSADLTGASTPGTNWGNSFLPNNPDGSSTSAWGTGNGRLLYIYQDGSFNWRLEHCTHGNQAWVLATGNLPKHTSGQQHFGICFGNDTWVAMNKDGQIIYVDIDGGSTDETDPANWTKADTQIKTDGYTVTDFFFSADDGATTGQFVAITNDGIGSAAKVRVYTSADGITWTNRALFENRALSGELLVKYTLDGTDLD